MRITLRKGRFSNQLQIDMSQATLGFLRGILAVVIMAVVTFLANAANLHGIVPDGIAALIAAVALAFEHDLASGTQTALFGTVSTQRMQ
jgi:hypothetical protein